MSSDMEQSEYRQMSIYRPVANHHTSPGDNLVRDSHFEKELSQSQTPLISKKRVWRQNPEGFSQRTHDSIAQDLECEGQVRDAPLNNKRRRTEFREHTQFREVQVTERSAGEYSQLIRPNGRETFSAEIFKSIKQLVVHHLRVFVLRYGKCGPTQIDRLVRACIMQRLGTTIGKGNYHKKLLDICTANQSTWKHRTLKALTAWVEAQIQSDLHDIAAEQADDETRDTDASAHHKISLRELSNQEEIWRRFKNKFSWTAAEDVFAFARAQVVFYQPKSQGSVPSGTWWINFWFLQLAVQIKGRLDFEVDGRKHPWQKENIGEYWDKFPHQDDPLFSGINPMEPHHFKLKPVSYLSRARLKISSEDLCPVARTEQDKWKVIIPNGTHEPDPDDILQYMQ
ncbi:hypothetical protein K3495_g11156 [Podosphaera aphanis]|nr:hypothetical protein K3495_g11156 [Podosphaera aphanis]